VPVSVSVSMSVGGPVSTAIKIFDETIERHIVIDTGDPLTLTLTLTTSPDYEHHRSHPTPPKESQNEAGRLRYFAENAR
jgi:hypothetical protein